MPARSHLSARRPARAVRLRLAVSGPVIALLAVAGGIAGSPSAGAAVRAAAAPAGRAATARPAVEPAALAAPAAAAPAARGPRRIARAMLARFHWSVARQFPALNKLWNRESGWRVHAYNRHSGAQGIPQADPGRKMASAGPDWSTNAATQIRWGLRYIRSRYGSPRGAWRHEIHAGWY
ncbi:MAG TPA: lytic transglycosylase domain-containing protein [Streptosporangiaceae bacterium]